MRSDFPSSWSSSRRANTLPSRPPLSFFFALVSPPPSRRIWASLLVARSSPLPPPWRTTSSRFPALAGLQQRLPRFFSLSRVALHPCPTVLTISVLLSSLPPAANFSCPCFPFVTLGHDFRGQKHTSHEVFRLLFTFSRVECLSFFFFFSFSTGSIVFLG